VRQEANKQRPTPKVEPESERAGLRNHGRSKLTLGGKVIRSRGGVMEWWSNAVLEDGGMLNAQRYKESWGYRRPGKLTLQRQLS
jgi:hypothetical protein